MSNPTTVVCENRFENLKNDSLTNKSVIHKFLHETVYRCILIVYKRILLDLDTKLED